jgi:hypothetical protein
MLFKNQSRLRVVVHDSHGRLLQAIYLRHINKEGKVVKAPSVDIRLEFARMGAAEFEHGEPYASLGRLLKTTGLKRGWTMRTTEVCAFGGWNDLFVFCQDKDNLATHVEEFKALALGAKWAHRDVGLDISLKIAQGKMKHDPSMPHAWLDIEKDVLFCVDPKVACSTNSIFRNHSAEEPIKILAA